MTDTRPPRLKLPWYQFRLRTLLITTLVLSVLLSLSVWLGGKNEAWEVVSINEEIAGTWNGFDDDGTPIGGALLAYKRIR